MCQSDYDTVTNSRNDGGLKQHIYLSMILGVLGESAEALSHTVLTTGLRLVKQPLSGTLLVTVAEDKEWLQGFKLAIEW